MKCSYLIFGFLILLGSNSIEGHITETIYEYTGYVSAGSNFPSRFASQFGIKANLKTQTEDESSVIFQFSNVNYQVSTGSLADKKYSKAKFIPAPVKSDALKQPFQVIYEGGKVKSMLTMDEPKWSINIKKSVATIFQLDVPNLYFNRSYSFTTDEKTLHGKCPMGYNVLPKGGGYVDIIKNQEYGKCEDKPQRFFTNVFYEDCPIDSNDDTILQGSTKYYKLFTGNHKIEIKNIFSQSVTAAIPFNGKADDQTILIRQNFTSLSSETIKEPIIFKPKHEMKNLKFVIPEYYNEKGTFSDLTGGHHIKSMDEIMEIIHRTLEDLVDFMMKMKISKVPEKLNNQFAQRLVFFFGQLDQECLWHCFGKYINGTTTREKTLRDTFLHITAQVGSKATFYFIRHVILSNAVSDTLINEIIWPLPFNIRDPSLEILKQFELLMEADTLSTAIKNAAILSISNMAFMTYKKYNDEDILNYYAEKFYKLFKDDADYEKNLNYLSALTNLEGGKAFDYLMEIATNKTYSSNLRYLALWGTKTKAAKNPSKSYNLYWPILSDREEEINMRAVALKLILITDPSFDRFLSVFWFMQAEKNSQLYYFFYTGMESFSDTIHPCYKKIGDHAKRLLRYAKKPVTTYLFTGDFITDCLDQKHSIGGYSMVSLIGDPKTGIPSTIHMSGGGYYGQYISYYSGILVKLNGISEKIKAQMMVINQDVMKLADLEKILSLINIKTTSRVKPSLELIYYFNNHVFQTQYLDGRSFHRTTDGSNSQKPPEDFRIKVENGHTLWYFQNLLLFGVHELVKPTDIGIPAIWSMVLPCHTTITTNTSKSQVRLVTRDQFDVKIRFGHFGGHSLSFYNPLGGMWHGVYRSLSHFFNIPFRGYLKTDSTTYVQIASIRNPESNFNLGIVHHTQTQVFITDYSKSNALHESCPNCSPYVTVRSLGNSSKEHNLIEHDSYYTGLKFKLDVFDCDRPQTPNDLVSNLYEEFAYNSHDRRNPIVRLLHGVLKLNNFLEYQPEVGSCGVILNALPSKKYPYTEVEGKIVFDKDNEGSLYEKTDTYYLSGYFTLKEDVTENVFQNYSFSVNFTHNHDHISNHLKAELTHKAPNQKDIKMCIDAENTYPKIPPDLMEIRKEGEEEVTGKLMMVWGESSDEKCPAGDFGLELSLTAKVSPMEELKNISVYPYSICHLESNEKEWKGKSLTPVTQACFRSAFEATTLRKFTGDISYFNISSKYVNYGANIMKLLKTARNLIFHEDAFDDTNKSMFNEEYHLDRNNGKIKYLIEFEKNRLHMSWAGIGIDQKYNLNYDILGFKPYLRSSRFFLLSQIGYDVGFTGSCVVTPSSVLTYDNDTYHYKSSNCYTLASADCSGAPTYAIFTKKVEGIYDLAMKLYIGGYVLEIIPKADGDFEMYANGDPIPGDLQHGYKYLPCSSIDDFYFFRVIKKGRFISIDNSVYPIEVYYNGHSVSTSIYGWLRGLNCGLCGDFNGNELYNERSGKDYVCPNADYGVVAGNFLGYRYTNKTEECPEITEQMMKKIECVEYNH